MPSSTIAEDDKQDAAGRDPARTPMQWDASTNAGFTAGKPWLPVDPSFKTLNVAAQKADPHSVLNFYRELLRLRRASPALRRGRFRPLIDRPTSAMAYLRETDGQRMFVALNFFEQEATVPLPQGRWIRKFSTHSNAGESCSGESLTLAPFEASIFNADVQLQ